MQYRLSCISHTWKQNVYVPLHNLLKKIKCKCTIYVSPESERAEGGISVEAQRFKHCELYIMMYAQQES